MDDYKKHLIGKGANIRTALAQLNELAADAIIFVVNEDNKLIGSLTDGDVRRGFLRGLSLENNVEEFIQPNPKYFRKFEVAISEVIEYRKNNFRIIPVLDQENRVVKILNFRFFKSFLPVDAMIMAGGRGERLRPHTDTTPKPLLRVGSKPIIEHNIDRLLSFGIDHIWISVRYLGEHIESYLGDGTKKDIDIRYVWEDKPLGTLGSIGKIKDFKHDHVLVMNSDILTDIDYEDFYLDFMASGADLSIVTIPYQVSVPYAVLETSNGHVLSFKEKPTYTYYSNGGIYLVKKDLLDIVPSEEFYNATDFIESLIARGKKVISYPLRSYWLDIGRSEDFEKAKNDINHLRL